MSSSLGRIYRVPSSFCVEVAGGDATAVVNNQATNDIAKLAVSNCCETFLTNIRGWVVAHAMALKSDGAVLLIGRKSDPQSICDHLNRYIIREDAQVENFSQQRACFAMDGVSLSTLGCAESANVLTSDTPPSFREVIHGEIGDVAFQLALGSIVGGQQMLICDAEQGDALLREIAALGVAVGEDAELETLRIAGRLPLDGAEISDKSIPQELDRDASAISFTKGCYLGQETIARLDARGQLQKKLSLVEFASPALIVAGTMLRNGDKDVGTVTSSATHTNADGVTRSLGLATLRRGSFDSGCQLTCDAASATVISR